MRKITLILLVLLTISCFAQVKDDFEDGEFLTNPTWTGDKLNFIVNRWSCLQLSDKRAKAAQSALSTSSYLTDNAVWEVDIGLKFNPSSHNFADFYLLSDQQDLQQTQNGYFLRLGANNDQIQFCKIVDGSIEVLPLTNQERLLDATSSYFRLRVIRYHQKWYLFYRQIDATSFTKLGSIQENSVMCATTNLGICCTYTASRCSKFVLDNLWVAPLTDRPDIDLEALGQDTEQPEDPNSNDPDDSTDPDTPTEPDTPDIIDPSDHEPPNIVQIVPTSNATVRVLFDEPVSSKEGSFILEEHYLPTKCMRTTDKCGLELSYAISFEQGKRYSLHLQKVQDVAGNSMEESWVEFVYHDAQLQNIPFGAVVFSEIMANPKGMVDYPAVEFVELYNRSDEAIDLTDWQFCYADKSYTIPTFLLPSHQYVVLCHEKWAEKWKDTDCTPLALPSFPVLANAGKMLSLKDAQEQVIAWVHYQEDWYGDLFKSKGGFSLECIDLHNLSGSKENWCGSTAPEGATPGKQNAVYGVCDATTQAEVTYLYLSAPDTLSLFFSQPMDPVSLERCDAYLFSTGHLVVTKASAVYPMCQEVQLLLSEKVAPATAVELHLLHLRDLAGGELGGETCFSIGLEQEALPGEVLLNEILFNPPSGGSDYIELYNTTDKYIALHHLFFSTKKEEGIYTKGIALSSCPRVFPPHSYLCFSKDVNWIRSTYDAKSSTLIQLSTFPSMGDTEGNIYLFTTGEEEIDALSYTYKMHSSLLTNKEGIALEKVNPLFRSNESGNWVSASSAVGGGTPGRENSHFQLEEQQKENSCWLQQFAFTPNGDGKEDVLTIAYAFTEENVMANVKIYDAEGRWVCDVAENYRLGSSGVLVWNGMDHTDQLACMGLYIVFVETYSPTSFCKQYKLGCALRQ